MKRLFVVTAFLLFAPALFAQDSRDSSPAPRNAQRLRKTTNATPHYGAYAAPRDEDDTLFVADTGSGLDTGCTYRSGGPLVIHVKVKRYVGENVSTLVSRGLLSPTASITMPAYDVDVRGGGSSPPEVDTVTFNGNPVGTLTGDNGVWNLNSWVIPIDWVKFPSKGSSGAPVPADNVIQINIDTASTDRENWCTAVDWVELEFKAIAPIFLVHGTNANSSTWDPNFTSFFGSSGAPWSNDINLIPNGSIRGNGSLLAERLGDLAESFGAKKCHVIAHSKGGLDTRAYLNNQYDPDHLKVLSVYTLSSPHHGTIISDIMFASRQSSNPLTTDRYIGDLIRNDFWWLRTLELTPQGEALRDQKTDNMARFNNDYPSVPARIKFYNYGADADLSGDEFIQDNEAFGLLPNVGINGVAGGIGTAMYRTILNVASIRVTADSGASGGRAFALIEVAQTNSPGAKNDMVASIPSAHSPFGIYLGDLRANHSTMKSTGLANTIFQRILTDFPIQ